MGKALPANPGQLTCPCIFGPRNTWETALRFGGTNAQVEVHGRAGRHDPACGRIRASAISHRPRSRRSLSKRQRSRKRRGGALRYLGPSRPAPSYNRPARDKPRQQSGWSSRVKRGPKKMGRSQLGSIPSDNWSDCYHCRSRRRALNLANSASLAKKCISNISSMLIPWSCASCSQVRL
jgi:hypothetical protein